MRYLKFFESFAVNEEVDQLLMAGIAKNIYLMLKDMPINQPLDREGKPMLNVRGEEIKYDSKAKMDYQNASMGAKGYAKYLNRESSSEITVAYHVDSLYALGFQKKEEAEKILKDVLAKYPEEVSGEIKYNPGVSVGGKEWPDTHGFMLRLKQPEQRSDFDLGNMSFVKKKNRNDRKREERK
jgi:hypothetical protein